MTKGTAEERCGDGTQHEELLHQQRGPLHKHQRAALVIGDVVFFLDRESLLTKQEFVTVEHRIGFGLCGMPFGPARQGLSKAGWQGR